MTKKVSIEVNGTSYQVEIISQSRDEVTFQISDRIYKTAFKRSVDLTPSTSKLKINENKNQVEFLPGTDGNLIKAPIPGVITKINVQVGEQIKKGDNLLLLEAMKMQNNIFSPIDAKVLEILVITGEEVSQDKILIKLS